MPNEPPDDPRLARALAGDQEALAALLAEAGARARPLLAAEIQPRWRARLSVDDILQVSYSESIVEFPRFVPRGKGSFFAWFMTIARHNLLDAGRAIDREQQRQQPSADSVDDLLAQLAVASSRSSPSRVTARHESRDLLHQALADLPPDARRLIQLYDLERRPVEDVANLLACSVGAVYARRARILRRLQDLLGPAADFFSDAP